MCSNSTALFYDDCPSKFMKISKVVRDWRAPSPSLPYSRLSSPPSPYSPYSYLPYLPSPPSSWALPSPSPSGPSLMPRSGPPLLKQELGWLTRSLPLAAVLSAALATIFGFVCAYACVRYRCMRAGRGGGVELDAPWERRIDRTQPLCADGSEQMVPSFGGEEAEFAGLQLEALIGQGGFAKVWTGRFNGTLVAVKVLHCVAPASGAESTECTPRSAIRMRAELAIEAHVIRRLRHPLICSYFGMAEIHGAPAIVLEYMAGGTLAQFLRLGETRRTKLAFERSDARTRHLLLLGLQIAGGIRFLHSHAIVHKDIKCSNVLLDASHALAKVSDFGLAHVVSNEISAGESVGSPGETQANFGTFRYLAPECGPKMPTSSVLAFDAAPPETVTTDSKSMDSLIARDMYAFAFVLYELLHERLAFEELCSFPAFFAASKGRRPAIELPPELADLEALISRCWHVTPEQRGTMEMPRRVLDALITDTAPSVPSGVATRSAPYRPALSVPAPARTSKESARASRKTRSAPAQTMIWPHASTVDSVANYFAHIFDRSGTAKVGPNMTVCATE